MPQMSPLKWLLLFMFFSATYLIFASIMYFNMTPLQSKSKGAIIKLPTLTWKW